MTLEEMILRHGSAPESGEGEGPVVSSRVRLARNLADRTFPARASAEDCREVWEEVASVCLNPELDFVAFDMGAITEMDKSLLFERHLISPELAEKNEACGVFVAPDESLAVMVNEEDHLRIQSIRPGLDLRGARREADRLDDALEAHLSYAFSSKLGYLTSCPSNVGTGMRASVMLQLPGLSLLEEIEPIVNGLSKIGLAVRGLWGEGSEATGYMFQVSNQITLGKREEDIVAHLEQIVRELIEHEANARARLMEERALMVEDFVSRAVGTLSNARMMSSNEALSLLSALRLGVDLGMVKCVSRREVDRLFVAMQPAHLQRREACDLSESDKRDEVRASVLRRFMRESEGTDE